MYNFGELSGTKQSIGETDFYHFSDGTTATRNRIGAVDIYSSPMPRLNGTVNHIGETAFGTWQDGTTSTHNTGDATFHNFSNGVTCTSNRIGATTFTNCQ